MPGPLSAQVWVTVSQPPESAFTAGGTAQPLLMPWFCHAKILPEMGASFLDRKPVVP